MSEKSKGLATAVVAVLIILILGVGAFAVGALLGGEEEPAGPAVSEPEAPDEGEEAPDPNEEEPPEQQGTLVPDEDKEDPEETGGEEEAPSESQTGNQGTSKPSGDNKPTAPTEEEKPSGSGSVSTEDTDPALVLGIFDILDWTEGEESADKVDFETGDRVSLYGWRDSAFGSANPSINGKIATYFGGSWRTSAKLTSENRSHSFLGIYPERRVSNFSADPYKLSEGDLLAAKPVSGIKQNKALDLTFEHLNAKVVVNLHFLNQWEGVPEVEKVVFDGYTEGTVDYFEGEITGTVMGEILLTEVENVPENFERSYEAVAIPASGLREIHVVIDKETYSFTYDYDIPLEKGKITVLDLEVGSDEITLANLSVSDWEKQGDAIEDEARENTLSKSLRTIRDGNYTAFENGDKISVFAWVGAADEVPTERVVDGAVSTFDGTDWVSDTRMLWADKASEHYFLAVYPAHEITDFKADRYVLDTAKQEEADLLVAINNGGLKAIDNPVQLNFDHVLAKLDVNINFRSEWSETPQNVTVTYKGYTTAEVDYMAKNVIGINTGDLNIPGKGIPVTGFDMSFSSVVIPAEGTNTVIVTVDGVDYVYEGVEDIPLLRGKVTTLNLEVGKDAVTFERVSISDWEKQGDDINGEAQSGIVNKSLRSIRDGNSTTFENGDKISVFGWSEQKGNNNSVPFDVLADGSVGTFDGTKWSLDKPLLWENETTPHYFLAVYPAREITDSNADTFVLDTADQEKSDLMAAVISEGVDASQTRGKISLNFEHLMAKLVVNLYFRNEFGGTPEVESVIYEGCTEAEVDYMAKSVTATVKGDVSLPETATPTTGYDKTYSSIVIPAKNTYIIRIKIDGDDYVFAYPEDIPLERGKVTTLNLNVGKDEITLNAVTVTDWDGKEAQNFENGEKIQIFGWTGDKTTVPANPPIDSVNTLAVENSVYRWSSAPKMLWQSQTAAHYFIGIYPLRAVTDFAADPFVLDESDQHKADILVAVSDDQGIVANNRGVDLEFTHIMARLKLNIKFENVQGGANPVPSEVKVYSGKEASVNYLLKKVNADAYIFDATKFVAMPALSAPDTGYDRTYESVMVPQTGVNTVDIIVDGKNYRFEYEDDIVLESGKTTVLDITVEL